MARRPTGSREQELKWHLAQHEADLDSESIPPRELALEKNFWGAIIMNNLDRARRILSLLIGQVEANRA